MDKRPLTQLLRLGPYVRDGRATAATMEEAAEEIERLRELVGEMTDAGAAGAGEWRMRIDKAAGIYTPELE